MRFNGTSRYTVPWLHAALEEIDELFSGDPWPYGLEKNRPTLERFARYLKEQGFEQVPAIEEAFASLILGHNE
jgi:4,5-dihydroxyphthalate decarboxylase